MVSSRIRRWTALALGMGAAVVAAGQLPTAHAATTTSLTITAKADLFGGLGAHMTVWVNGTNLYSTTVSSTSYRSYKATVPSTVDVRSTPIVIQFDNDQADSRQDRNLYVQSVFKDGFTITPSSPGAVYDLGTTYQTITDGQNLSGAQPEMVANGGLRWNMPVTPVTTPTPAPTPTSPAQTSNCRLNDGSLCPDSYFTGPLGAKEILPQGQKGFFIDYFGVAGWSTDQQKAGMVAREAQMGRKFDSLEIQANQNPNDDGGREQWVLDTGHKFATVAWNPTYDVTGVSQGKYDSILKTGADYFKNVHGPVMIRMFTEFTLNSSIVNAGKCGTPFITAWRHVVDVFKAEGATNVGFWYNPDDANNRSCVVASYPGDTYVDWVGSDSYNWQEYGDTSGSSTPLHPGQATFPELFFYTTSMTCADGNACPASTYQTFGPRKPFVVGETGTINGSTVSRWKPTFLNSIASSGSQKYLKGVAYYDSDVAMYEGDQANFRMDAPTSDPAIAAAAKAMVNAPFFTNN